MTSKEVLVTSITITQPEAWVNQWRLAASRAGLTFSEWIGQACNRELPEEVAKRLPGRPKRGRKPPA
jgi:hypothetical protein